MPRLFNYERIKYELQSETVPPKRRLIGMMREYILWMNLKQTCKIVYFKL
jgi:hypothetical protein